MNRLSFPSPASYACVTRRDVLIIKGLESFKLNEVKKGVGQRLMGLGVGKEVVHPGWGWQMMT